MSLPNRFKFSSEDLLKALLLVNPTEQYPEDEDLAEAISILKPAAEYLNLLIENRFGPAVPVYQLRSFIRHWNVGTPNVEASRMVVATAFVVGEIPFEKP